LHLFLESNKVTDPMKQKELRSESVVHLRRAIEIYPDFLNATFDLGRVYETMQQMDSAYVHYEKTTHLDSTFTAPYFSMAIIQQNKGNLAQAIPLYEKFLTRYPYQIEVYANLSYAYYLLGKYDSSVAVNKRSLLFIPNSHEAYVNIGKTYLQMKNNDSAYYYLDRANTLKPGDPMVQSILQQLKK
jgi:tetratricopeptide (TPR) repeat protein